MDFSSLDYTPVNLRHFLWVTGFLQEYNAATENEMALARQLRKEECLRNPSQTTPGEEVFQRALQFIMAEPQREGFFIPKRLQEAMDAERSTPSTTTRPETS